MIYLRADVITDEAVVLRGPVDVAALAEQPCPGEECVKGTVPEWHGVRGESVCRYCDGRGSQRPEVGVVVEQWGPPPADQPWKRDPERRLRVVRYGRPTDALRVSECWQGRHQHGTTGLGVFLHANGEVVAVAPGDHGGVVVVPIREPWAADLQPGQTVLLFDQLHECDEPPPDSGDTETEQEQP